MIKNGIEDTSATNIIIAHYVTASILFFTITCLLYLSSEAFIGHYFHPKLLAITHITTLGWISMVIIGSLYQLMPVITNAKLFSIKLSVYTYFSILIGVLLLAISFWVFDIGYMIQMAASLLFLGISLFLINLFFTVQQTKTHNIESDFIITSVFWFWLTALIGALLAFNFRYAFLPKEHLYYLKIHAHIGVAGWFLCLIMGVASKLIPMFLLSGKLNNKRLKYAYYFLNSGLSGFVVDSLFFNGISRSLIYISLIICGIISFILFIGEAYKGRARKKLDIGLKHSFISFLLIVIPIILWILLKSGLLHNEKLELQISLATGFSILFGFISLLILGQTFKNLSFIVWLKKYQSYSGKTKTPLPKDLYSEKIATIQLYSFLIGFIVMLSGMLLSKVICIKLGSVFLIVTSVLYAINVFKIAFHKNTIS